MKIVTSDNRREFLRKTSKVVHKWKFQLEIFSRAQAKENSR